MTDQGNPVPEFLPMEKAHIRRGRPVWSLSHDEQRFLGITFTGGLASIVVGAGLIGVAITLARNWSSAPRSRPYLEISTLGFVLCSAVAFASSRAAFFTGNRPTPLIAKVLFGISLMGLCFVALIWVGVAAGVK